MRFATQLSMLIAEFDLDKAETLSNRIHQAEVDGYEVTEIEDNLWYALTQMILAHQNAKQPQCVCAGFYTETGYCPVHGAEEYKR